jgi:translation initiation factor eIF-2B subunit epsilon
MFLTQIISKWFPIVKKFTHSEIDQVDCLNVIVDHLLKHPGMISKTPYIIKQLYEIDLLEEDGILDWFDSLEDASGPLKKIKDSAQPFIDWLKEADAESEDDDDSDDD